ncbi:hypothetical protein [Nostoc linckia]|uniref:hypothetical protein n=1 Tax=Nostoc linckia TaxID=92942 RepID=UPI0015D48630|nr:hypothetical protein [Nostoc linckia]
MRQAKPCNYELRITNLHQKAIACPEKTNDRLSSKNYGEFHHATSDSRQSSDRPT